VNIVTGVNADPAVNAHYAKEIGTAILDNKVGKTPKEYSFKRKDQVVTMACKHSVKVDNKSVVLQPLQIFQRLLCQIKSSTDMETAMEFELCNHPASTFDTPTTLRKPVKSEYADAIYKLVSPPEVTIPREHENVIDGGDLLHRIAWKKNETFKDIFQLYVKYIKDKYQNATIAFDGYTNASSKDMTHSRRAKGLSSATVDFTEDMKLTMTKEAFLANNKNKQRFRDQ
jgi:hypothetical protein